MSDLYVPPVVFCPTCDQDTLPNERGYCLWCLHKIGLGEPSGTQQPAADTALLASPTPKKRRVHDLDFLAGRLARRAALGQTITRNHQPDVYEAARYHGIQWADVIAAAGLPAPKVGRPRKQAA